MNPLYCIWNTGNLLKLFRATEILFGATQVDFQATQAEVRKKYFKSYSKTIKRLDYHDGLPETYKQIFLDFNAA